MERVEFKAEAACHNDDDPEYPEHDCPEGCQEAPFEDLEICLGLIADNLRDLVQVQRELLAARRRPWLARLFRGGRS